MTTPRSSGSRPPGSMSVQATDPAIAAHGIPVVEVSGVPPIALERWVRRIAALSAQPVDWAPSSQVLASTALFAGQANNTARVLATGDLVAVSATVDRLVPDLRKQHPGARVRRTLT